MNDNKLEELQGILNSPFLNYSHIINDETCIIYKCSSFDEIINYVNFVKKHNIFDSETIHSNFVNFFNQKEIKCNDFHVVFTHNKIPQIMFKGSEYQYNSSGRLCCYDKILKVIFLNSSNFPMIEKLQNLTFTEFMQGNKQDLEKYKRNCYNPHEGLTILNQSFEIINAKWYFVTEFSDLATEFVRSHYRGEIITDKKMRHLKNGKTKVNYEEAFKTAMCREMFSICLKDISNFASCCQNSE